MKFRSTFLVFLNLCIFSTFAFGQHMQVSGRFLQDSLGNNIILRGLNYGIIDVYNIPLDNYLLVDASINEVAQTGANALRITWYTNGTHYKDQIGAGASYGPGTLEGYVNNGHLSHLLQYVHQKGMIPILEIHSLTGGSDNAIFQSQVMGFWTDPDVLQVINENKNYLIINLANEFGDVLGTSNPVQNLIDFKNNYILSVQTMRNLDVNVPIMIDAPDYGISSSELAQVSSEISVADPIENLIFSVHGYWGYYATSQALIETKIDELVATNNCFFFGEIANRQADAPTYCGELDISAIYPLILNKSCIENIGWLAWTWDEDCDPTREISSNGMYSNLTAYGNNIVNNVNYGLKAVGNCSAHALPIGVAYTELSESNDEHFSIYPNPSIDQLMIAGNSSISEIIISDLRGNIVLYYDSINAKKQSISIVNFSVGIYLVNVKTDKGTFVYKFSKN